MSRKQRHIKSQSTTTYEEPYAIIERPTNATFIPTETMEGNEEKTSLQQACKNVCVEPGMAEDKEAKGQA